MKYPFKMAMVTLSVLALFPSNGHKHLHIHTPDHCHVAKSCANECIGIICSLTLVVWSNFVAEFCPFLTLKYFSMFVSYIGKIMYCVEWIVFLFLTTYFSSLKFL